LCLYSKQFGVGKVFSKAGKDPELLNNVNFEKLTQLEFKGKILICNLAYEGELRKYWLRRFLSLWME